MREISFNVHIRLAGPMVVARAARSAVLMAERVRVIEIRGQIQELCNWIVEVFGLVRPRNRT